ncbi:YesK family protein [Bacillus sp. MUM 13]|uniref:YesK family protein n=1 Tax=Bacillus sp. MUM 13 TaxID=1678001 RepID=UPI0009F5DFAD|nr:YesK family protein [Bacillus sp. MUM 13]
MENIIHWRGWREIQNLIIITVILIIVIAALASYLLKKYPSKKTFTLPGLILTTLSLIAAIVSYLTADGWTVMGYSILFAAVAIASLIGTAAAKIFTK